MAKLAFSKLGLKTNNEIVNIHFNDQIIEVKQYISVNDKLKLISEVINNTIDEHNFCNPVKVKVYLALGILDYYTNINFTEKQKEDPAKLYDLIINSDLWKNILNNLNKEEYNELLNYCDKAIESYYKYYNSVFGILESINKDYQNLNLDATEIQKALSDPENMGLLRDILTKLG